MKRSLFFVIIGLMLLSGNAYSQKASDFVVDLNKEGNGAVITKYKGTIADVVIPSNIEGYPVMELGEGCFKDLRITSVKLPNGVVKIGDDCFENCSLLKSINLPETLTHIGGSAFMNTKALTLITIPESVKTFANDFPENKNWYPLFYCSGLKKIVFSGNRESVSANIFKGLKDMYDSNLLTLGIVNKIWDSAVEEIVLPKGLKKIEDNSFSDMSKLKTLIIPDTVQEIGANAFESCFALTAINIPASVTTLGEGAFNGCINLKTIIIPNTVKNIGVGCFADCEKLTSVTLPKELKETSPFMFARSGLTSIVLPATVEIIGISSFMGTNITDITFPSGLKEIQGGAFYNCSKLKNLVFPDSISSLTFSPFTSDNKTYFAFTNCDSLSISAKAKLRNLGYKE